MSKTDEEITQWLTKISGFEIINLRIAPGKKTNDFLFVSLNIMAYIVAISVF